jgi:hypothetical protein
MRDPVAAGEWIRSAELAPWLDPAVATYALHLALEQPDEALAWARRVGDTRRREQIQVKMGSLWLMQRPDDGRAVLERADFSDAVRERIEAAQAKNAKRRRNAAPAAQPSPASEPEPPLAPEPAAASAG